MFGAKFCSVGVVVVVGHVGSSGVALQSIAGDRGSDAVGDGHIPLDTGAEPSGHAGGDVGVLSIVAAGELPLLSGVGGAVAEPFIVHYYLSLLPLLPATLPLPLLSLLLANAKFTLLLSVTKVIVGAEDTSVSIRNTKIIFLAG